MTTAFDETSGADAALGALRPDLAIEAFEDQDRLPYRLVRPDGSEFDLHEVEFRVVRALDGVRSAAEVARAVKDDGFVVDADQLRSFHDQLATRGFLVAAGTATRSPAGRDRRRDPTLSRPPDEADDEPDEGDRTVLDPHGLEPLGADAGHELETARARPLPPSAPVADRPAAPSARLAHGSGPAAALVVAAPTGTVQIGGVVLPRRALALLAGSAVVFVVLLVALLIRGPRGGHAADEAGAVAPTPAGARPAPAAVAFRLEQLAHPRAIVSAPTDGTIVETDLTTGRDVDSDERLFAIRPARGAGRAGEHHPVRAPFAGRATPRADVGSRVDRGAPLADLVDLATWQLDGSTPATEVSTRWSCRVRATGVGEAPCTVAQVERRADRAHVTVRTAAAAAPWIERARPDVVLTPP